MSDVTRCPLAWPAGWPRTPIHLQRHGRFSDKTTANTAVSVATALARLRDQVRMLAGETSRDRMVVSSNMPVKRDGLPYSSGAKAPADRGVAVYFADGGQARVLACDSYFAVADNIAAIAAHIDAMRAMLRHGVGSREQAFAGYTALPPAAKVSGGAPWHEVLRVPASCSLEEAEVAYRALAMRWHPDRPQGDAAMMRRINEAIAVARFTRSGR